MHLHRVFVFDVTAVVIPLDKLFGFTSSSGSRVIGALQTGLGVDSFIAVESMSRMPHCATRVHSQT